MPCNILGWELHLRRDFPQNMENICIINIFAVMSVTPKHVINYYSIEFFVMTYRTIECIRRVQGQLLQPKRRSMRLKAQVFR